MWSLLSFHASQNGVTLDVNCSFQHKASKPLKLHKHHFGWDQNLHRNVRAGVTPDPHSLSRVISGHAFGNHTFKSPSDRWDDIDLTVWVKRLNLAVVWHMFSLEDFAFLWFSCSFILVDRFQINKAWPSWLQLCPFKFANLAFERCSRTHAHLF